MQATRLPPQFFAVIDDHGYSLPLVKRFLLFLIIGVLGVVAISLALRLTRKTTNATIAVLLPQETIAFAHFPDFAQTRADWYRSDIYQLYAEPTVQEFLRNPLARLRARDSFSQTTREIEQLDPKDVFVALTSIQNDSPKFVGGFRFRGSQSEAEPVIAKWRSHMLGSNAKQGETVDYQQHKIENYTIGLATLVTVYDGRWFFVSNDIAELKAVLDREDGRVQDRQSLLSADETFRAAMAEMPSTYALCFYLQPKVFTEKFRSNVGPDQRTLLQQIRCICGTTRFENGKMHDVIFAGMPRMAQEAELTRKSIGLGTKDSLLYVASLINFSQQLAMLDPGATGNILGAGVQKIAKALVAAGVTAEDWKAAFGSELGALADWPANMHWPFAFVSVPVRDMTRAKKIASVLAHASDEDAHWKETDRNGVHYLSMQSGAGFLVMRPTIAISDRMMIIGLDEHTVEAAMERSAHLGSELSSSATYKSAARSVPEPTNFFAYIDTALLYSRLDTTLRPILLMGAAFLPAVNEHVDLSSVPPTEVVTKHLSPIVSSQTYRSEGYVTESVGPITLSQSGIALAAGLAATGYIAPGWGVVPPRLWSPTVSPTPSGTP
jgi:hypothetical protein